MYNIRILQINVYLFMKLDKDFPHQRDVGQAVIETTIKPIVSLKNIQKSAIFLF